MIKDKSNEEECTTGAKTPLRQNSTLRQTNKVCAISLNFMLRVK